MATAMTMEREIRRNGGAQGMFLAGDAVGRLEALLPAYEGKIKLIYMDPPFMTGDRFYMRVRLGAEGWRKNAGAVPVPSYVDKMNREQFLALLRSVLVLCRRLLRDDGMVFVHVDYRADAHVRLLLDEIFGERCFINEIIWVYQTGGRSKRYFSRKHDVIFFYGKTERYDFNIDAVMAVPDRPRTNHMRRHVDPDGRVYRSIRSNGRVYTYYDDAPVAPTDVWTDVSHLQQKDPERTGYDNQKPLALLERIVRCASREGEWVLDPFAGSCTALEAARRNGRRFIGIDQCPLCVNIARRRLHGADSVIELPDTAGPAPACRAHARVGIGFYMVELEGIRIPVEGLPEGTDPWDAVDNWSVGYLREDGYHVMEDAVRTRKRPELPRELAAPAYEGQLAVAVGDVLGRTWCYAVDVER